MAYLLRSGEKRKEADYTGEDEERALNAEDLRPLELCFTLDMGFARRAFLAATRLWLVKAL